MPARVIIKLDKAKLEQIQRATAEHVPTWIISDGVDYGVYHELGTTRIHARPFLVPAFESKTRALGRALGQAIERGVSLAAVMSKTAFDVQKETQANITEKHIFDTGNLFNSINARPE